MKIAIVGAGGVGGYIGAKLIHKRVADVTGGSRLSPRSDKNKWLTCR